MRGRSSEGLPRLALALGAEVPFTELEPVGTSWQEAKRPGREPQDGGRRRLGGPCIPGVSPETGRSRGQWVGEPDVQAGEMRSGRVQTPGWCRLGGKGAGRRWAGAMGVRAHSGFCPQGQRGAPSRSEPLGSRVRTGRGGSESWPFARNQHFLPVCILQNEKIT